MKAMQSKLIAFCCTLCYKPIIVTTNGCVFTFERRSMMQKAKKSLFTTFTTLAVIDNFCETYIRIY